MPYIPSGKCQLYYEEYGDGPPVLLAHGVGGNHASWFGQVPVLQDGETTLWDSNAILVRTDESGL